MNNEKKKLCVVTTARELPILGGIIGPIHHPSDISIKDIIKMVNSGITVYEVNPKNYDERILLTTRNIIQDNFNNTSAKKQTQSIPTCDMTDTRVPVKTNNDNNKSKIIKPDFF